MGRKMRPIASPWSISGQKKSSSPAAGEIWKLTQSVNTKNRKKLPGIIRVCLTPACSALPMKGTISPDATAPGSSIKPVCCERLKLKKPRMSYHSGLDKLNSGLSEP